MNRKRIEFRHLHAFVEVCSERHFTRAAQVLNVSQPTLSSLVLQLEEDLGVQLLIRTTRSVELTPAGHEFLVSANRIVADLKQSIREMQDHSALRRGRLRIAALPSLCTHFLPRTACIFSNRYPNIALSFIDVMGNEVVDAVLRKSVDIGIGYVVEADGVVTEPLLSDRLVAVAAVGMIDSSRALRWKELAEMGLIAMSVGTTIRRLLESGCAQAGIAPRIVLEASQLPTALAYARNRLGIAVLPSSCALNDDPELVSVDLIDPTVERSISLIRSPNVAIGPAASAFLSILRSLVDLGAEAPGTP